MNAPWLEAPWRTATQRLLAGRVPHAMLVSGPPDLGKRDFARRYAQRLLCQQASGEAEACGACRSCALWAAGSHPDFTTVTFGERDDGKLRSEITVEQIRALGSRLAMTSQFGGWQVAIIEPAEAMNTSASNALLKTLEEPSRNTLMILVSDAPARLSATIRSRCQALDIRFPARGDALAWLEGQGAPADQASFALTLRAGHPTLALASLTPEGEARTRVVLEDLERLAAGRARAPALVQGWLDDQPIERVAILSELLRVLARAVLGEHRDVPAALLRLSRLLPPGELPKLWRAWEGSVRVRAELSGPLRADLVLSELLFGVADLWSVPHAGG